MTCNICSINEATIHLTEIVNEQMVEVHLCESCAQEKGTDFKTHFNFGDLLSGLSSADSLQPGKKQAYPECPHCHLSYEEFGKSGRLGCPSCYGAFSALLLPLIKRVQRSTAHVGKKPANLADTDRSAYDLRLLQERLRKSIEIEAFEDAAKLRDEIKKLETGIMKKKEKKSE